jgi:hypothetical protein
MNTWSKYLIHFIWNYLVELIIQGQQNTFGQLSYEIEIVIITK